MDRDESPLDNPLRTLKISYLEVVRDPALSAVGRGDRKVVVTSLWTGERHASHAEWKAPGAGEDCPVLEEAGLEIAFFRETARQDRHWHERATEVYTVLDGRMKIEVDGRLWDLAARDSIVVRPGAVHFIPSGQAPFLCQVMVPFCAGPADKYVVGD